MKKIPVLLLTLGMSAWCLAQNTQTSPEEPPQGWWSIPKTNTILKLGGYVKLDVIQDFNPIGSPYFFDVSQIPTDSSEGMRSTVNARETRLHLETKTPSKVGEIRTYIEGDFYGSNGGFRLRHALVEINGKWLAGQWWSNFMDESIIPATLDFEKPAAYAFSRNGMLRFKQSVGKHAYLAFAIEQPQTGGGQAPAEAGQFESNMPDLTGRFRIENAWGHFQFSAYLGRLTYRYDAGGTDHVLLYAGNISGRLNFLRKDYFIYQVIYGPGAGRQRAGQSTVLDENGNIVALTDVAFTVGIHHYWSPTVSSVIVFNHGQVENPGGMAPDAKSQGNYGAINLLWNFVPNGLIGIEYLRGMTQDISTATGYANRLQVSVKYAFN